MATRFKKYGTWVWNTTHPASLELEMIKKGGRWISRNKDVCGNGYFFHYKKFAQIVWPEVVWHKWLDLFLEGWLQHKTVVVMGPASSGKTFDAALCHLIDYYAFPSDTTVLACSTTRERLEDRIWGEIKSLHKRAKGQHKWLAGNLLEGRQRIVTDSRTADNEGRDFRNGMVGVPCYKGQSFEGISGFVGIKNKRLRLLVDELSLMPRSLVDSLANLSKNPDFRTTGLGNPKDTTDALGVLGEPSPEIGGWESGVDQAPGTKTWKTRRPHGVCIQFDGEDSPNLDGKLGIPLITQKDIDDDIAFYGRESVHFTMMDLGRMPRGQGSRRVLTRQACIKFGATRQPVWLNSERKKIASLDAAFRSVGGDRCILTFMEFGEELPSNPADALIETLVSRDPTASRRSSILGITEQVIVPIKVGPDNLPEDQIAEYCMDACVARDVPPNNFFMDAAMRTSLVTAFCRLWSVHVNSIDCMGSASEEPVSADIKTLCKDYYFNKITEIWYSVRLAVEAGQIRGFTDEIIMEFASREWMTVNKNKIQVEPKKKMKEKTGRSPDLADSVAIGLYGARQLGFKIKRLKPPPQKRGKWDVYRPDWRDRLRSVQTAQEQDGVLNHST